MKTHPHPYVHSAIKKFLIVALNTKEPKSEPIIFKTSSC